MGLHKHKRRLANAATKEGLITTVIGSYPVQPTKAELVSALYGKDPFLKCIDESVNDQIAAGVDIISDGQVRADMIRLVTAKLKGFRDDGGRIRVAEKIEYNGDIVTKDFIHAKNAADDKALVKGILTGPCTLASFLKNEYYADAKTLIFDLADALALEARNLCENGAAMIQIDEPIFAAGGDLELGKQTTSIIARAVDVPLALHVCGDVSPAFPALLDFEVDILAHEFSTNMRLIEELSEYNFDKKLGFGCVDSKSERVESVAEIKKRIERALQQFKPQDLLINPDCGLRNLSRECAFGKLKNMCLAAGEFGG